MEFKKPNFQELVYGIRRRGLPPGAPPRSIAWAAETCGISVSHLYNLFHGRIDVPEWTVYNIAERIGFPPRVVQRAIELSQLESGDERP